MSGFLDRESKQSNSSKAPFAKKKKAPESKVVKLNAELHYLLKTHVAYENDGSTITDHINKAVEEYVKKHNIKPLK